MTATIALTQSDKRGFSVPPRNLRILLVKPNPSLGAILGLQGFQLLGPLELGYLAAVVPPRHEVRVLDLRLGFAPRKQFLRAIRSWKPDLVGFTGYTHEASTTRELAKIARYELAGATIVVGGHHATVAPDDYDLETFDAVVRGEGTGPFRAIVEAVEQGEPIAPAPMVRVPGTTPSETDAAAWPQYPDPSTLPMPRRDLWDSGNDRSVWLCEEMPRWGELYPRVSLVRSSYGCKMQCTFCIVPHLSQGNHMPRNVDLVAEEIANAPGDHIYFVDDENFIDPDHGWQLADALERRGVRKRYFAWTRATTVNNHAELFRRWRQIGLDACFIGFEFTSDKELKVVHKGGTTASNERAVDTLRSIGIAVHAAFLILPEWTEDDFTRLRNYVRGLPPIQCSFTICTPSPGTPDWTAMRERVWVDDPYDLYDCMHPLTPTTVPLRRFAELYSQQASEGLSKVPLRVKRHPTRPWDIVKVNYAGMRYAKAYRELYRDYPRELWG